MDYKYGMTTNGDVVSLPTDEQVIWKFLSYPSKELSDDIWRLLSNQEKMLFSDIDKRRYN